MLGVGSGALFVKQVLCDSFWKRKPLLPRLKFLVPLYSALGYTISMLRGYERQSFNKALKAISEEINNETKETMIDFQKSVDGLQEAAKKTFGGYRQSNDINKFSEDLDELGEYLKELQ
jgi:hypothetical protein